MDKVLIIANAEVKEAGKITAISPVTAKMVTALKEAITANSPDLLVEVVSVTALWSDSIKHRNKSHHLIYCPLTIQLPNWLGFPAKKIYQACQDIEARRAWVEQNLAYKTSIGDSWLGDHWLPVILTAKGLLYGAAIGEGAIPNSYQQPVNLSNELSQALDRLASQLLQSLSAPPAVYLLQFSLLGKEIVFDRLWPFPAAPAIASLGVQQPDLFACHWYCLTNQPIQNLGIIQ